MTEPAPAAPPSPKQPILALEEVHVYYGAIHALKGVSLTVHPGEIVTLIGANGAGKSTTLRAINGINKPRQGTIRFQGQDITGDAPHRTTQARGQRQAPLVEEAQAVDVRAQQRHQTLVRGGHLCPRPV